MDAQEVLTTTRSVRKRLDLSRPVLRAAVEECVEIALQAPTGSNSQSWHWVVVDDADTKQAIADHYGRNFDAYVHMERPRFGPDDTRTQRRDAVTSSATYLREHLHEAPVMAIPCIEGRLPEGTPSWMQASFWGSVLPGAWSFMLALRTRGLGSAWTTLHLPNEREVAELVGIPFDRVTQAGLFPVAYTLGTGFKPAPRLPLESVLHWGRW